MDFSKTPDSKKGFPEAKVTKAMEKRERSAGKRVNYDVDYDPDAERQEIEEMIHQMSEITEIDKVYRRACDEDISVSNDARQTLQLYSPDKLADYCRHRSEYIAGYTQPKDVAKPFDVQMDVCLSTGYRLNMQSEDANVRERASQNFQRYTEMTGSALRDTKRFDSAIGLESGAGLHTTEPKFGFSE